MIAVLRHFVLIGIGVLLLSCQGSELRGSLYVNGTRLEPLGPIIRKLHPSGASAYAIVDLRSESGPWYQWSKRERSLEIRFEPFSAWDKTKHGLYMAGGWTREDGLDDLFLSFSQSDFIPPSRVTDNSVIYIDPDVNPDGSFRYDDYVEERPVFAVIRTPERDVFYLVRLDLVKLAWIVP